ncbi:perosamine synthetase [Rhodoligotrophos appendicifer]|uniref:DegT/DnrJ/EryC1/StrS family aminotransferase n=1 Tax=Rhodoligotrophos appendicifer TaxID=987056 RepID=UPI00117E1866|nr:DegT/DnrJ/EryC1/StrS family aminotransferase [Rhodoligotrophos appendicifer]
MSISYPVSRPSITALEIQYVTDAVRSGWISSLGSYISRFEADFAALCGTKHAVSVCNGTAALHLALLAMGIERGDEVIVPDLSFIATANAVLMAGATPVFCDVDPFTLCLDPRLLEGLLTGRTKAIMPVHLYGHPADMRAIVDVANRHGLLVIEDAAEAHGATIEGQPVGSFGACGTFSFYGNKNLTTGEGGMVVTDDGLLAQRCRLLRDHAMSGQRRYWHQELGYNYRMTNLQAAVGCAQLDRAEALLGGRRALFKLYQDRLASHPGLRLNRTANWAGNSFWMVCVEIDGLDEARRDAFMGLLKQRGVDTRPYFHPMSDMPYLRAADTPQAHRLSPIGLNLPTYVGLEDRDVDAIVGTLVQTARELSLIA